MKIINHKDKVYASAVEALVNRSQLDFLRQDDGVRKILKSVKKNGDPALLKYTRQFDKNAFPVEQLRVSSEEIQQARAQIKPKERMALEKAAENIRKFHQRQVQKSWKYQQGGVILGQVVRPLEVVGIYVPGGKASYPSSVLMNAIPATVAGVGRIVMCSPQPGGEQRPHVLAAAAMAGVDEIYRVGGAQAIAAMAYGTETIPRVDKIVGPGNIYVALAKRMVYGIVDIDMIAGPSEILILADESARPSFVAADLLSQAEHDEDAVPILITPSEKLAQAVQAELEKQKMKLNRRSIIETCLKKNCRLFVSRSMEEAVDLANRVAPEHLELAVKEPARWAEKIKNAGAVFLGHFTPEAIGDYLAGPNHVLPTGGTGRFASPLGVYDFIKRTSLISYSQNELKKCAGLVTTLAQMEDLHAHANAVKIRIP